MSRRVFGNCLASRHRTGSGVVLERTSDSLPHEPPANARSVEEMGRQMGLSRSAPHERFVELTGQAPLQYLANWPINSAPARCARGR